MAVVRVSMADTGTDVCGGTMGGDVVGIGGGTVVVGVSAAVVLGTMAAALELVPEAADMMPGLVGALLEGRIAGAGLDVFEDEPHVPPELRAMDNVVLTPHDAAFTEESAADLRELMIGNLEAFFAGKPLLTPVPLP
ncbi:unnamed protein product [Urochloa humidicola]